MSRADVTRAVVVTRAAVIGWVLRLVTAAGLGVDAGIHAYLAPTQPPGGHISQTQLFYAETVLSSLAALLVLLTAARWAYGLAFLVAASALGAVLLYRYVDVGPLGPLPDMYEPFWYATKTATTIAEAVAVVAAAAGVVFPARKHLSSGGQRRADHAAGTARRAV